MATAVQEEQGVSADLGARHIGRFVVDDGAVAPVGRDRLEAIPPGVLLLRPLLGQLFGDPGVRLWNECRILTITSYYHNP